MVPVNKRDAIDKQLLYTQRCNSKFGGVAQTIAVDSIPTFKGILNLLQHYITSKSMHLMLS